MELRPLLKVEEVRELLGISRGGAYAMLKRGDLPSVRIGRLLFVRRVDIDKILYGGGAETR